MKKCTFRIIAVFLLFMAIQTAVSWRLDQLRTPLVTLAEPTQKSIEGQNYSCVLPSSAVRQESGQSCIYIVEKTRSAFYPLIGKQAYVNIEAMDDEYTAVSGVYVNGLIVADLSSRPLLGEVIPVNVLKDLKPMEGRVEVLAQDNDAAFKILSEQLPDQSFDLDEDRIVLSKPTEFTAQQAEILLRSNGIEARVLDYSWGPMFLRQGQMLWRPILALTALVFLVWFMLRLVQTEWKNYRNALQKQYRLSYLNEHCIELLTKAILLVIFAFAGVFLLRYLIEFPIVLPPTLLSQTQLFAKEAYQTWFMNTFPENLCSGYGLELLAQLKHIYFMDLLICIGSALTILLTLFFAKIRCLTKTISSEGKGALK